MRRFVYFQGKSVGSVAYLYSTTVNNIREFYVLSPLGNQKVFEIPNQQTLTPIFSWGDAIGDSIFVEEEGLTLGSSGPETIFFFEGTLTRPPGTTTQLDIDITAQWISGPSGRSGIVRSTATAAGELQVTSQNRSLSDTTTIPLSGQSPADPKSKALVTPIGLRMAVTGFGFSVTLSGSVTHTINAINSHTRNTFYESWVSASTDYIFVTIKYLQDFLLDNDESTQDDTYDRLRLITINRTTGQISGTTYEKTDTIPTVDDWRSVLNNFKIASDITPADVCVDTYFQFNNALLFDGHLFLVQGENVTKQSADSSAGCTLGDAKTIPVDSPQIPGTLEGSVFLP